MNNRDRAYIEYGRTSGHRNYYVAIGLLVAFAILTALLLKVDVAPIGPQNSKVGLSTINKMVHDSLGVNMTFYKITEYLGYLSLAVAAGFGFLGLIQLVRRRSLFRVDKDILLLGGFYVLVIGTYVAFEKIIINYRPIIMDEGLEASFPSSHSMLVVAVMGTAVYQISKRVEQTGLRVFLKILTYAIIVIMVVGRLLSGVHWFTDIVAGVLLADAYIMLYFAIADSLEE